MPAPTPTATTMSAEETRRSVDQHIVAERGFAEGGLLFGGRAEMGVSPWHGSLGPFSLGMTVDTVRSAARRARIGSSGNFSIPQQNTAWCAPPVVSGAAGLVLAPQELNFESCQVPSGACASYRIKFTPVGESLRVSWIYWSRGAERSREVGRYQLAPPGNTRRFASCRLVNAELTRAIRWDNIEDLALRDKLGVPEYDRNRLPSAVRTALDQWQRSVTVEPEAACCDVYSLYPGFNAYWTSGGNFVVSYKIGVDGVGSHAFSYVVVSSPGGRIVWTGSAVEFGKLGLNGKNRTPQEVDQGK